MTIPWTGFPLAKLVELAKPLSSAKYLQMQTFQDKTAPGFRQVWYPWPYTEGLTIEEANNELAFLVTGMYGKPALKQMGAPLRLAVPWKYGFKSVKSIVRFSFIDQRPKTFWEGLQASEYGFWANVNPDVPHPLNLFRVHWFNDSSRRARADVPGHIVLDSSLTGVPSPIVVSMRKPRSTVELAPISTSLPMITRPICGTLRWPWALMA